jgi:hypothetical protein
MTCLRGASAVAEVLKAHPDAPVRVLVVWEPVLPTDWGSPSPSLTSFIGDRRAVHFFDRDRRLSVAMGGPGGVGNLAADSRIEFRMKDVIWDVAFVYPPGARWGDRAAKALAPVVDFGDDLSAALAVR